MASVPKVVVGWHDFGQVVGEFTFSLANMALYSGNVISGFIRNQSCYLTAARNVIVNDFLKSPFDFLLMVDGDLEFNADALNRTLAVQQLINAPILYGSYCLSDGRESIFADVDEYGIPQSFDKIEPKSIYKVAAGSTGWMLATREALEAFRAPFSHDPWPWFNHDLSHCEPEVRRLKNDIGQIRLGEDITFSRRAASLGIDMYGYTGLLLIHHKSRQIISEFMKPYAEEMGLKV